MFLNYSPIESKLFKTVLISTRHKNNCDEDYESLVTFVNVFEHY